MLLEKGDLMEEPLIIFHTKFNEYLERIDFESNNIKEILKEVNLGNARTGHFNRMEEGINKIKELLKLISRTSIREDIINEEVKKRLMKILQVSTLMAKEPERITQEQADKMTSTTDTEELAIQTTQDKETGLVEEQLQVAEPVPVENIITEPVLSEPNQEDENAN